MKKLAKRKETAKRKKSSPKDNNVTSVSTFFLNASMNEDDSNTQDIRTKTPAYGRNHPPSKPVRKNTTKRNGHSSNSKISSLNADATECVEISCNDDSSSKRRNRGPSEKMKQNNQRTNSVSKKSKQPASKKVQMNTFSKEAYITENENQDSMHQDTDYGDIDCNEATINTLVSENQKPTSSRANFQEQEICSQKESEKTYAK